MKWESNRRLGDPVAPGSAATRWWTTDNDDPFYIITKDPSWRTIYHVTFVYSGLGGELREAKVGSAYTVPEAKKLAKVHAEQKHARA